MNKYVILSMVLALSLSMHNAYIIAMEYPEEQEPSAAVVQKKKKTITAPISIDLKTELTYQDEFEYYGLLLSLANYLYVHAIKYQQLVVLAQCIEKSLKIGSSRFDEYQRIIFDFAFDTRAVEKKLNNDNFLTKPLATVLHVTDPQAQAALMQIGQYIRLGRTINHEQCITHLNALLASSNEDVKRVTSIVKDMWLNDRIIDTIRSQLIGLDYGTCVGTINGYIMGNKATLYQFIKKYLPTTNRLFSLIDRINVWYNNNNEGISFGTKQGLAVIHTAIRHDAVIEQIQQECKSVFTNMQSQAQYFVALYSYIKNEMKTVQTKIKQLKINKRLHDKNILRKNVIKLFDVIIFDPVTPIKYATAREKTKFVIDDNEHTRLPETISYTLEDGMYGEIYKALTADDAYEAKVIKNKQRNKKKKLRKKQQEQLKAEKQIIEQTQAIDLGAAQKIEEVPAQVTEKETEVQEPEVIAPIIEQQPSSIAEQIPTIVLDQYTQNIIAQLNNNPSDIYHTYGFDSIKNIFVVDGYIQRYGIVHEENDRQDATRKIKIYQLGGQVIPWNENSNNPVFGRTTVFELIENDQGQFFHRGYRFNDQLFDEYFEHNHWQVEWPSLAQAAVQTIAVQYPIHNNTVTVTYEDDLCIKLRDSRLHLDIVLYKPSQN